MKRGQPRNTRNTRKEEVDVGLGIADLGFEISDFGSEVLNWELEIGDEHRD
jgi:hypothetical protein